MLKKGFVLKTLGLILSVSLLGGNAFSPVMASSSTSNATVVVDSNVSQGTLLRTEKYNNTSNIVEFPDQRAADVKFLNDQGLHGEIYRTWLGVEDIYNKDTDKYDYSKYTNYFTTMSKMSDAILVNIPAEEQIGTWGYSPDQLKAILKNILKYLKQNYPKIKYIEALNEPNYPGAYHGTGVVTADNVYSYYQVYYEAVNEVNAELNPTVPLQVGGPAFMYFDLTWMSAFLDDFKNDPSPDKKLDFISYHAYFTLTSSGYNMLKSDPSQVSTQRAQLDAELSSRGLDTNIPSYITEIGLYPGPFFDDKNSIQPDQLRQAAGMASYMYWYMNDSKNVPFNWTMRHPTNGRKDQLVTKDAGGNNVIYTDKFTPYGNMLAMMSKMKANRISATSNALSKGKGVYAIASQDRTGVSLLAWNYQETNTADYQVTLQFNNLPRIFDGKNVRVKTYKIDSTTSNYFTSLDNSNLQMVADQIVETKKNYNTSIYLEPNSLQLLVLEPIDKGVYLSNSFDDEVTGANPSWTVNEPSDTSVSIVNVPSASNKSVKLYDNSTTNNAEISKTFTNNSGKVSVEWRFKGETDLVNNRFQLRSGSTVAADLYINNSGNLVAGGIVITKVSAGTWYNVKVIANTASDKYDVYVNDRLKAKGIAFKTSVVSLDNIFFKTGVYNKNSLYIDNVRVSKQ